MNGARFGGSGTNRTTIVEVLGHEASQPVRVLSRHGGDLGTETLVGSIADCTDVQ